jgi:hypothetical protein
VSSTTPAAPPAPGELIDRLDALGVPDAVLDRLSGGDAYADIVRALSPEPTAWNPTVLPGDIIVVVGELDDALTVSRDICHLLRMDASRILIASESTGTDRHIGDAGDAARRAKRLRSGDIPRLVVVDAPADGRDGGWARGVLAALRPDTIWAVVDPARKTADTSRHLSGLGGVDAIAVHGTARTADPASPLVLGVPIALIDGRPATAHVWAGLLCERLFEEAAADGVR